MTDEHFDAPKMAFEHAWAWFSLHAAQRMQTFNFFLVATAFMVAGYAALLQKTPVAALVIGVAGAWIAFWFTRLDSRTRQLINAGEAVLKIYQADLAKRANIPAAEILQAVENPTAGTFSYRVVIAVIEWTVFILFLLAAGYAAYRIAIP